MSLQNYFQIILPIIISAYVEIRLCVIYEVPFFFLLYQFFIPRWLVVYVCSSINFEWNLTKFSVFYSTVSCTMWEKKDVKKANLSVLDISSAIIARVEQMPENIDYFYFGKEFWVLTSVSSNYLNYFFGYFEPCLLRLRLALYISLPCISLVMDDYIRHERYKLTESTICLKYLVFGIRRAHMTSSYCTKNIKFTFSRYWNWNQVWILLSICSFTPTLTWQK